MRVFIGADPGLDGAIALMTPDQLFVEDMPTVKLSNGKRRIDMTALAALLGEWSENASYYIETATVEEVHAMPGQGVTSMFSFGFSAGSLQQALASAQIHVTLVRPGTWKALYGLRGGYDNKAASVAKAVDLFPKDKELFYGPKGGGKDGRAEAALLAHYGSRLQPTEKK